MEESSQDQIDVYIDQSVFKIISGHISVQNMGAKPMIEEKSSRGNKGLKQTLSDFVRKIWEKEKDSMKDETVIELSETENVVLLHVESPESFYVMRTRDRQLADWLRAELQKEFYEGEVGELKINDVAVVKEKMGEEFSRVQIFSIESEQVWVYFLDQGRLNEVSLTSLVSLSPKLSTLRPLAHHCCLANVARELYWNEDAGLGVAQFFGSDIGKVTVLGKDDNTSRVVVSKCEDKADISLLEYLSVRGLAHKMESEERCYQPQSFRSYHSLPLDTSVSYHLVKVVHVVSPGQMFVNLVGKDGSFLKYMDNLVNEIQMEYKDEVEEKMILVPYVGLVCVTPHDEKYCRAVVQEVLTDKVRVKLVDIGLEQLIQFSKLRRIPDKFLILPEMAVKVGLVEIDEDQDDHMQSHVEEVVMGKVMRMEIREIKQDEYMVLMYENIGGLCNVSELKVHANDDSLGRIYEGTEILEAELDLEPGTKYSCRVISAKSPGNICLRKLEDEEYFYEFHREINTRTDYSRSEARAWRDGDSCLVKTVEGWVRARVGRLVTDYTEEMVELLLFDYGSKILSETSGLRLLPSKFSAASPFSWTVRLPFLMPAGGLDTWTTTTCEALRDILEEAFKEVDIILGQRVSRDIWEAELFVKKRDVDSGPMDPEKTKYSSVRELLVGSGLALPTVHVGEGDTVADIQELSVDIVDNNPPVDSVIISGEGLQTIPEFYWEAPRLPCKSSFVGNVSHVDWDCNLHLSSLEENSDNLKVTNILSFF